MWLDIEGRPQAVHESSHCITSVAHDDPQIFNMSHLRNLQPVIETMPPFIFIVMRVAMDHCGYSVLLWKNGHYLKVQFPGPSEPPKELSNHLDEEIKQLQPFANSLVFGKTNCAYFVSNQNGKRALAYRQKPRGGAQYPPFAPLVHESELTYLRPVGLNLVEGIWRGQQVDAWIGVDDMSIHYIEQQMKAYELLRGLDLTYEILAHTVDSDGEITGLIGEPAFGRPFQASDLLALDDAMRRIHERDLFWYLDADNIMLSLDNKIRLLSYSGVRKFRDAKERENHRLFLQKTLHEIYLSYKSVYHHYSSHRYQQLCPGFLGGTLSVEWPLVSTVLGRKISQHDPFADNPNAPLSVRRLHYRRKNVSQPLAVTTKIEEVESNHDGGKTDDEDKPLVRVDRQRKHHHSTSSRPYNISSRKPRKSLLAPE